MRNPGGISKTQAQKAVIEAIGSGATVEAAMKGVHRTLKAYEYWRKNEPEFAAKVDEVREAIRVAKESGKDSRYANLSFVEWRKEFLNRETYPHMQQWIDVLEGREPKPIDGCDWIPRSPKRLIINVPPFHAKTQTLTDWLTYMICMNPNIRIAVISKRKEQAQKTLHQVRQRLTSTLFAKLQAAYAPEGGWKPKQGEGSFSNTVLYVAGRTSDTRDPTLEALGMGGQIYGSRYDLIILDDCIVQSNANEFEKQIDWIESEVESRVYNGSIVMIGTRLASQDLYSEIQDGERYMSGKSPWSYLRQPMVLRYGENPEDWVTLWPKTSTAMDELSDVPDEDGMYVAWDGPRAAKTRAKKPPKVWSLVYQQDQISDDATFQPDAVKSAVNRMRKPGPLAAGGIGHPRNGAEGMYVIATMDPAMAGDTFTLVGAVDKATEKWFIENAWVQTRPSPVYIRDTIKRVTEEYGVREWIIESNAFQLYLTQDPVIVSWLAKRGVKLVPHYTGSNKADPDFGVSSVAPMFGTLTKTNDGAGRLVSDHNAMIELPDPDYSAGIRTLIDQLPKWQPGVRGKDLKQDGVMALWFFAIGARRVLGYGKKQKTQTHRTTRFMSRGQRGRQMVVPSSAYAHRTG